MVELDKTDMDEFVAFHAQSAATSDDNAAAKLRRQDKFLVLLFVVFLLALAGIALLLMIPLAGLAFDFLGLDLPFFARLETWWYMDWQGLQWAAGLGVVALVTALWGRHRILNNASLYVEAGCPSCQEHDLFRVRRYRRDRLMAAFGFPIRRYACRNCTWKGTRLAGLDPEAVARLHEVAVE